MKTYNVNEIYSTFQGEGSTIGKPSVFVRLYGCNFRCSFCDSMHSVEGRDFDPMGECELYTTLVAVYQNIKNVVFTGGEPLLQFKDSKIISMLLEDPYRSVEFETNGTMPPPAFPMNIRPRILFNVSPKRTENNKVSDYKGLQSIFERHYRHIIKLPINLSDPVEGAKDIEFAKELSSHFIIPRSDVYLMPITENNSEQSTEKHNQDFLRGYDLYGHLGYNIAPRLHIMLHGNKRKV